MSDGRFAFKRWDDMQGGALSGLATAALTVEVYRDTPAIMEFMRHDQDDAKTFYHQTPHAIDPSSGVGVHLHVVPMSAAGGDLYMRYWYVWVHPGGVLPALVGWTTAAVAVPLVAGDQYKHTVRGLVTIPAPVGGARESDLLVVHVQRNGTDPLDTYNTNKVGGTPQANVGLLFVDGHILKSAMGSLAVYGDGHPGL